MAVQRTCRPVKPPFLKWRVPGAAVRWSRDITGHVTVSGACWRLLDARETVRLVLCFQPHRQPGFYFNLENRRLGFNIVVWRGDSISTAERVLLRSQVFLYQSRLRSQLLKLLWPWRFLWAQFYPLVEGRCAFIPQTFIESFTVCHLLIQSLGM